MSGRLVESPGLGFRAARMDRELTELVDAIVEVADRARDMGRLRLALEPFGGSALFDAEIRLNGTTSDGFCVCSEVGLL